MLCDNPNNSQETEVLAKNPKRALVVRRRGKSKRERVLGAPESIQMSYRELIKSCTLKLPLRSIFNK